MILKIKQMVRDVETGEDSFQWILIDGITQITTENEYVWFNTSEELTERIKSYGKDFLEIVALNHLVDHDWKEKYKLRPIIYRSVDKDGKERSKLVLSDDLVYICNNEGKTIDTHKAYYK